MLITLRISRYSLELSKFVLPSRNRRSPPADFSYTLSRRDALHDDLIVAWRATGGSEEVRKEGRGAKGARCACMCVCVVKAKWTRERWTWTEEVRTEKKKKRGKFGTLADVHTSARTAQGFLSPVLTRSQIARSRDIVFIVSENLATSVRAPYTYSENLGLNVWPDKRKRGSWEYGLYGSRNWLRRANERWALNWMRATTGVEFIPRSLFVSR